MSRFIKSADGTEIYADAIGTRSPGTPVLVLIHGAFMVKGAFNPLFEDPKWTASVFLVRYDTRGHGRSGKSTADEFWESKRFWEDFEAVCREFDVRETYILGWSVGSAQFADIMAYNNSIEIRGCINVAGAIHLDPSINQRTAKPLVFECGAALTTPSSVDAFQEALFRFLHVCSEELSPDLFRILLEGMVLQPRGVAKWVNKRTQNPEKMLREARAGRLPQLAISGGRDELLIYRHLPDADHMPWVSCADEFREVVLTWLKSESTS